MTFDSEDLTVEEPPTLEELEALYKKDFPGFEPLVWSAMAYFAFGLSAGEANLRLKERYGDRMKKREEECKERVREIERERELYADDQTANEE